MSSSDIARLVGFVESGWENFVLPLLFKYIIIENKSPEYYDKNDPAEDKKQARLAAELYLRAADKLLTSHKIEASVNMFEGEGRTPLILIDIASTGGEGTILMYGHLDKQPPMTAKWREGLHPYKPVVVDGKLYGRGAADDGYAMPAALTAICALHDQQIPLPRIVILIEAGEESGSPDLEHYITEYADRIGTPDLVICLDSGCGSYNRLWNTTSLRGVVSFTLRVDVLTEEVHSGSASGIIPPSDRILQLLIARIQEEPYGSVPRLTEKHIPADRQQQIVDAAKVLGSVVYHEFPFVGGVRPMSGQPANPVALLRQNTWGSYLALIGQSGIPESGTSGNVMRPFTEFQYSLRLPPTGDPKAALDYLEQELTWEPPYGAKVTFTRGGASPGWNAPPMAEWLVESLSKNSIEFFGQPVAHKGEGGTIPFMKLLGNKFPQAQFLITGVLGPGSNAHGPNEFLDIPTGKRLTAAVAGVIVDFTNRPKQ